MATIDCREYRIPTTIQRDTEVDRIALELVNAGHAPMEARLMARSIVRRNRSNG